MAVMAGHRKRFSSLGSGPPTTQPSDHTTFSALVGDHGVLTERHVVLGVAVRLSVPPRSPRSAPASSARARPTGC